MTQPPSFDDGYFASAGGRSAAPQAPLPQGWPQQPNAWQPPVGGYLPPQAPQQWNPPQPPKRRVALWLAITGFVVVAFVAAGIIGVHISSRPSASSPAGTGCNAPAPKGASPAARQFLAATAAADVYWQQVGAAMKAEGGVVHRNDLLAQVNADKGFLASLEAISFPADAEGAATSLEQLVGEYDQQLTLSYDTDGYLAAHQDLVYSLDNQRALTSGSLRQVLGIPNTICVVDRP